MKVGSQMSTAVEQIILKEINAKYPITVNHIEKITNEMYRCSNNFNEYYVRVTDYRSFEEQLEEINWLSYLEQHGVGISPIIKSLQGNLVEKGESFEEKSIVLFGAAKGIHLSRSEWKGDVFKELGRQIGRMHRITSQYEQEHEINHMINWYDNAEYRFLDHIPKEETTIRKLAQKILNEVQLLSKDRHTYGLLHGDLWLENVLVNNHSEITLIDFQDCEKHFYLYDLIVPIYSALEYSFAGGEIEMITENLLRSCYLRVI